MKLLYTFILLISITTFSYANPKPAFKFYNIHSNMHIQDIATILEVPEFSAAKVFSRGIGIKPLNAKGFFKKCYFDKIFFSFTQENRLYRIRLEYDEPSNEFATIGLLNALKEKYPSAKVTQKNDLYVVFEDEQYVRQQVGFFTKKYRDKLK